MSYQGWTNYPTWCIHLGCDGMPHTLHRHGQLLSLLRELYMKLYYAPQPVARRAKDYRARLLRVIDTVNERLREVAS